MHDEAWIQRKTLAWTSPQAVEEYARRIAGNAGHELLKNEIEVRMFPRFAAGTDILDVGIGTGRASLPLARSGYRVTGIDSSAEMLRKCRELAGETSIDLRLGDIARLPFDERSFDTVMALNAFAHFPHWRQILTEWRRVLRPGGRIIFDVFSLDHDIAYARAIGKGEQYGIVELAPKGEVRRLRLPVEDIAAFGAQNDLQVAAIVPYGLFSGISGNNQFVKGSVLEGRSWHRFLSWVLQDESLHDLMLLLEEEIVGRLTSAATWRYLVVLQDGEAQEHNAAWVMRNREYERALCAGLTAEALARFGNADMPALRSKFQQITKAPSNLFALARILLPSLNWNWKIDLRGFLDEAHCRVLERIMTLGAADRGALDTAGVLSNVPELAAPLEYLGVPLGRVMEYELVPALLKDVFRVFDTSFAEGAQL